MRFCVTFSPQCVMLSISCRGEASLDLKRLIVFVSGTMDPSLRCSSLWMTILPTFWITVLVNISDDVLTTIRHAEEAKHPLSLKRKFDSVQGIMDPLATFPFATIDVYTNYLIFMILTFPVLLPF